MSRAYSPRGSIDHSETPRDGSRRLWRKRYGQARASIRRYRDREVGTDEAESTPGRSGLRDYHRVLARIGDRDGHDQAAADRDGPKVSSGHLYDLHRGR